MSSVDFLARGGEWVQLARFERAADAVRVLPALARDQGTPVRCSSDSSITGTDIPKGVSFDQRTDTLGFYIARP